MNFLLMLEVIQRKIQVQITHTHILRNRKLSSSMVLFSPSPQEVASELKPLKTICSSGDDQIRLSFITIAADVISPYLSFLIDFMFSNGLFLGILKIAKVIPIFKLGEKQTVNNFTPISLFSPFSKVIEKIIKVRLLSFIARNDVLFQRQSGFRKNSPQCFRLLILSVTVLIILTTKNVLAPSLLISEKRLM